MRRWRDIECFDGTHKTILNSSAPLHDGAGALIGGVIVNQDVTGLRRVEVGSGALSQPGELGLAETNHRMKNSLQLIASFLDLQSAGLPATQRQPLLDAGLRLQAIARVHDLLRIQDHGASVAVDRMLRELCRELGKIIPSGSDGIELECEAISLPAERAVPLCIIANELIMNAIKHALPRGGRSLRVGFRDLGDALELCVRDDGPGLPLNIEAGLGMRIVARLTAQLGGRLGAESSGGARYIITFPKLAT